MISVRRATVIGLDAQGKSTTLRKGTGVLVCLADDPRQEKFNVACYHKDLEPFMARGRELAALGTKGRGAEDLRWKEIQSGTLAMPKEPRLTTIVQGSAFDAASGTVADSYTRWVIYTPGRDARVHGPADHARPGCALADVPGHSRCAHHDQPGPAEVATHGACGLPRVLRSMARRTTRVSVES